MNDADFERAHVLPDDAADALKFRLGLVKDDPLRIAFFGGPGDVVGTFEQWRAGKHDRRTPVIAYSEMFYSLASDLNAEALILCENAPPSDLEHPGFTFEHVPRRHPKGRVAHYRAERKFCRTALEKTRRFKPHITVLGGDAPNALINSLVLSTRVVLSVHNAFWSMGRRPTNVRSRMKLALKAQALRRVHGAVCTSEECARQARTLGVPQDNCTVEIPQVLPRYVTGSSFEAPRAGPVRQLVFLGRIEPEKGVFDLLQAFRTVASQTPELTLHIAGTGSASTALEKAIADGPFSERIIYHGLLDARSVHALLDTSDLLICPTRDDKGFVEGLALVVVEAAVHGVPSIVSTAVPARDLFPEGCAVFCAGDCEELTGTLKKLVDDPVSYRSLTGKLREANDRFFDRSLSWSSALFHAMR